MALFEKARSYQHNEHNNSCTCSGEFANTDNYSRIVFIYRFNKLTKTKLHTGWQLELGRLITVQEGKAPETLAHSSQNRVSVLATVVDNSLVPRPPPPPVIALNQVGKAWEILSHERQPLLYLSTY